VPPLAVVEPFFDIDREEEAPAGGPDPERDRIGVEHPVRIGELLGVLARPDEAVDAALHRPLDADVASYGAVYTYAFSKRTDVSFVLTRFDNSDTAQVAPGQAGFYGGFASEPGEDVLSTAIGIRHRF